MGTDIQVKRVERMFKAYGRYSGTMYRSETMGTIIVSDHAVVQFPEAKKSKERSNLSLAKYHKSVELLGRSYPKELILEGDKILELFGSTREPYKEIDLNGEGTTVFLSSFTREGIRGVYRRSKAVSSAVCFSGDTSNPIVVKGYSADMKELFRMVVAVAVPVYKGVE